MNKIAINKIQAKVRELITGGYLEDALNESEQLSFRHKDRLALTNLEAQLNQAKADLHAEKLNNDDYSIRINRITNALLELIDKALVEENESNVDKTIAFFKRFWAVIVGLGVVAALLSDSKSVLEGCKGSTQNNPTITVDSLDCGFPQKFKDDSLYILITAFENDAQRFSSDCFGQSLLRRIDAKNMPIKICYRPDLSPKQREEVKRLQTKYNTDLVLWGNLKNLSQNCGEGDICFKSLPSDTIIKICGGQVETEKSDLNYEKGISSEDIEQGALHIGDIAFDSWILAVFNAKVGRKKPDFFVVDEKLPAKKQAELWNEKGDLYLTVKNLEKSKLCYETSLKTFEINATFYKRAKVKDKLKDFNGAVSDCDIALSRNFINANVFQLRSIAKRGLQDYEAALNDISKAIDTSPLDSYNYFLSGIIKNIIKDYKGAIDDYDKAIEINPQSATFYCNRGSTKFKLKDYKGAIIDCDKALEINPNYGNAYNNRGSSKSKLKDYQGAIVDYDKAIGIDSKNATFYFNRGSSKVELNDNQGAIVDYDKAIEIDHIYAWAYSKRGIAKSKLKDYQGAIVDSNKAIEIDPKEATIYYNRGIVKYELKYYESAIKDYDKGIELDPKVVMGYTNRGNAKFALKDYKGAIMDYDKVIGLDTNEAKAYYNRGNVFQEIGEKEKADRDYEKAKKLDSSLNGEEWYYKWGKFSLLIMGVGFLIKKFIDYLG